jgi:ADP-heptose:LPS heptosyltransferase/Flp pilus assembly protein TadD
MAAHGDCIMATAECRDHLVRTGRKVAFGDGLYIEESEIFLNNPNIATKTEIMDGLLVDWLPNYDARRPYVCQLRSTPEKLFYTDWSVAPGEIFLTEAETQWADQVLAPLAGAPFTILEPSTKNDSGGNKNWLWDRWIEVCAKLSMPSVQLGPDQARALPGAHRIVTPSFRLACAVLSRATAIICTEGGLHHAAAALGIPGVVIFGGFVHPRTTGYPIHMNLFNGGEPCGNRRYCPHCRSIMEAISVEDVLGSLQTILNRSATLAQTTRTPSIRQDAFSEPELRARVLAAAESGDFIAAIRDAEVMAQFGVAGPDDLQLLGMAYYAAGALGPAETVLRSAIRLVPDHGEMRRCLGVVLRAANRLDDSVSALRIAMDIKPEDARTIRDLAISLRHQGEIEMSKSLFAAVLRQDPADHLARAFLADAQLATGDLHGGVDTMAARDVGEDRERGFPALPWWTGDMRPGRLLLWTIGLSLGDQVMYAAILRRYEDLGRAVTVVADPRLQPMFQRRLPCDVISREEAMMAASMGRFRAQGGFESVLRWVGFGAPRQGGPLVKSATLHRLGPVRARAPARSYQPRIGIAWFGARVPHQQDLRAPPLEVWRFLLEGIEGRFINLSDNSDQSAKDPDITFAPLEAIRAMSEADLSSRVSSSSRSATQLIERTIAMIAGCDVIVSVDSIVAHIAGFLDVPTILLIPFVSSWRWCAMPNGQHFYPSVRIARQHRAGCWDQAVRQAKCWLQESLVDQGGTHA